MAAAEHQFDLVSSDPAGSRWTRPPARDERIPV